MTLHRIGWQACTLYVAEMAPKERRGFMVATVNNVGATGLVVSHARLLPYHCDTVASPLFYRLV